MAEVKDKQEQIERGNISVHTENIFPIIKKSLYSDHEIFLRELVSNAIDASKKIAHLAAIGKYKDEIGELKVVVELDKEAKTLTIKDRGIGMSADEVRKYINQVAFSGAEEFIKKFKEVKDTKEIIGQFGLGFYSAFMVSEQVEIISRSYKKNQGGVHWTCDGSTEYTLEKYKRTDRGTDIILHIAEDSEEFLEEARIQAILDKYAKYLPYPVEFNGEVVNKSEPIWNKPPADLTDEDYINFFKEMYPFSGEPLFWIHLNVDYPFELTGILFFPKLRNEVELKKDKIHLYSRQVFITDNVQDIVPEYLGLLQGVIDSPDIPLNVSRSYLQTDSNVRKISTYISKKVAEKLKQLYKEDRDKYQEKWSDIEVFIKYGMISDDKFYDRVEDACLFKNVDDEFYRIAEYKEKITPNQTDKDGSLNFIYTGDKANQDIFVQSAKKKGIDVLLMNSLIDSHFIGLMERKIENSRWKRVDSETADRLIPKDEAEVSTLSEEQETEITEVFKGIVDEKVTVKAEALGAEELPVVILRPEFFRRMQEQAMLSGMKDQFGDQYEVIVNTSHNMAEQVLASAEKADMARQLLDLAKLSQGMLNGGDLTQFIERSVGLIGNAR